MQIAIALVTLALCGGFLWWFRRSENRRSFKRSEEESAERERKAQETAQEFVNAKDLGNNCLYTTDGFIFAYIKIEGLNLELYSRQEQKLICRELSAGAFWNKAPIQKRRCEPSGRYLPTAFRISAAVQFCGRRQKKTAEFRYERTSRNGHDWRNA